MPGLLLASTSRYRRELLERLRLPFAAVRPEVDEGAFEGESPRALCVRLGRAKARAVAERGGDAWVIGSDQVAEVDGRTVLLFSCLGEHAMPARAGERGGTWAVTTASLLGPFDVDAAYQLTDESLYVGRLLQRRDDGRWLLFAFRNVDAGGAFVGGITDPMPVHWVGDRLAVSDGY